MRFRAHPGIACLLLAGVLAACANPSGPSPGSAGETSGPQNAPSRLTVGIAQETGGLATKLDGTGTSYAAEYHFMTNSPLTLADGQDAVRPVLARARPSQEEGTWRVNPDGTMATTWTIRSGALWHDGQPVTPSDFLFALQVYQDPDIAVVSRLPERFIDRAEIIDQQRVAVYWKQPYPYADRLGPGQLEPLPQHLVGDLYQRDKVAFQAAPFWTGPDYVGTGPYRLVAWDKGVQLVFRAFDQYFLGKPGLDEIIFRVITDPSAVVADLLSGGIDTAVNLTLPARSAVVVRDAWAQSAAGQVLTYPTSTRFVRFQFDPALANPPALRDARVRRAIIFALDHQALADVAAPGAARPTDTLLTPANPYYQRVSDVIMKYSYDQTRALSLLADAGWTHTPSGALVSSSGESFALEIRTPGFGENEPQLTLMTSNLRNIGMDVTGNLIPQSRMTDKEYTETFPGLYALAGTFGSPDALIGLTSEQCPTAASRYVGKNDGCWSNSEFDNLVARAITTLDEHARGDAFVQAHKVISDQVALFTTTYVTETIPVPRGLEGVGTRSPDQKGNTWNVQEWHWAG